MKTVFTALAAASGCTAARWYLERSSRREVECLGGWVRLKSLWNEGAAFGLPVPFPSLAAGVALGLTWSQRRRNPLGAGLILGGGLSNLAARVRYSRVYDYIQFPKAPVPLRRYVFNLADFSILAGGAALLASRKKPYRRRR